MPVNHYFVIRVDSTCFSTSGAIFHFGSLSVSLLPKHAINHTLLFGSPLSVVLIKNWKANSLRKHKTTSIMKTFAALTSLLALLSMQSAVGDGLTVQLTSDSEVPPVTSSVTGTATLKILSDSTIQYSVNLLNPDGVALLGAAGAHIHCGVIGENGIVVAVLSPVVVGGLLTSPGEFSGVLNDDSIVDPSCGATIAQLYASIIAGATYVNVHSSENPSGEVRGQTPKVMVPVDDMSGGNEVPAVTSSVTGTATIELIADGTINYSVSLSNPDGVALLGVAGAHIHCGAIDATGVVVASLAQAVAGGRTESVVDFEGVLDVSNIVDGACGSTTAEFSASIIAGRTYINVHSSENPSGEVRGQILGFIPAATLAPTGAPTKAPTVATTGAPTKAPTDATTGAPTKAPTDATTGAPTKAPTTESTKFPTTNAPTSASPHFFKFHSAFVGLVVALVAFVAM
jgi:hypothetical protein